MTTHERIKRIADKAGVPYAFISIMLNSSYGKNNTSFEDKLKTLEKEYGTQ